MCVVFKVWSSDIWGNKTDWRLLCRSSCENVPNRWKSLEEKGAPSQQPCGLLENALGPDASGSKHQWLMRGNQTDMPRNIPHSSQCTRILFFRLFLCLRFGMWACAMPVLRSSYFRFRCIVEREMGVAERLHFLSLLSESIRWTVTNIGDFISSVRMNSLFAGEASLRRRWPMKSHILNLTLTSHLLEIICVRATNSTLGVWWKQRWFVW